MKLTFLFTLVLFTACTSQTQETNPHVKPCVLEFFETYTFEEIKANWLAACEYTKQSDTLVKYMDLTLEQLNMRGLTNTVQQEDPFAVGYIKEENIAAVDSMLKLPKVMALFPKDLVFLFSESPLNGSNNFSLYAVKMPANNKAIITGKDIENAAAEADQTNGTVNIMLTMTENGSSKWEQMTRANVGKSIAIVVDRKVVSCPLVYEAISGGKTQINGVFSIQEGNLLAARINAGR
jgi:SecD/SecF fusion protein